jgi:hypothetical protein
MATIQLHDASGHLTVQVSGVLDIYAAREACAALTPALAPGWRSVSLEVSGVEEVDLAGVQLLQWFRTSAAASGLALAVGPPGEVVLRAMRSLALPGWGAP